MIDLLLRASLRHRTLVLAAAAMMLAWGGWTASRLPVDVFPDLNRPTVTVLTEAGGLSPEEVEVLVSRPVESAMHGAPGVERVRSQSAPGLSVVWIEFAWEVDPTLARQQVGERLAPVAGLLPEGVRPAIAPLSSIMGEILLVGVSSPGGSVSGPALRSVADTTVRPRLLAIPGVSQVTAIGGGVEQVQVEVDPTALARFGVPLADVERAAAEAQGSTAGGFVERKSQELQVRNLARSADPARIAEVVIATRDGVPVTLGQVAQVRRGPGPLRGDAGVNGRPAVVLSVQKQPGADTLALTAAVEAALVEVGGALGPDVTLTPLFRQADFIAAAVRNVEHALRDGVVLVTLVLVVFLLNVRTTAITLTAIPLSFVVTAVVLHAFGLSVNTMTLGGLAVATGELVDDAIVDVENVFRRLRANARAPSPRPAVHVVYEASREVRGSIVYSTALVVLVFVPLFALGGVEGRLFAPLGVAYVTAILASLFVSLTVTPVLCLGLLPGHLGAEAGDGALVRWLKEVQRRLLARVLPHPGPVLGVTAGLILSAGLLVPTFGTSFLPTFHEGTLTLNLLAAPGTSLGESNRLGALAERLLLEVPEVVSTGRRTGRAELDEHAEGVHYTEIDVDLRPGRPRAEVLADVRARLDLPGVAVTVGQPISHRLDHLLSGVRAAIAVKLHGQDLAALRAAAADVADALRPVPGLVDLTVEPQVLVPQLQIVVDRDAARRYGIAPGRLTAELEGALAGSTVGQVVDGLRTLDLVVRIGPEWREDIHRLASVPIVLDDGRAVPIRNLAALVTGTGPNQILHENGQRRVVVSANTAGRDGGSVAADVRAAVAGVVLPAGTWATVGGQFAQQEEAATTVGVLGVLALVGMYVVLWSYFRSHTLVVQVLLNLPLALLGAVVAIAWTGQPLSVATLVGFVTLCGIASRNTILLIAHYVHLAAHEGEVFGAALVQRGSQERLVPVLMTATCAGLGLVPLAFAGPEPGNEILTPVAQVILGGLVSSTLLDLVVTPTVFLHYGRAALERLAAPAPDPSADLGSPP